MSQGRRRERSAPKRRAGGGGRFCRGKNNREGAFPLRKRAKRAACTAQITKIRGQGGSETDYDEATSVR